jgi:hypothetical protein
VAETVEIRGTDSLEPERSRGMASAQAMGGIDLILADLVVACLDLDGHNFPIVLGAHPWEDVALIDLFAASGELFLAVTGI